MLEFPVSIFTTTLRKLNNNEAITKAKLRNGEKQHLGNIIWSLGLSYA